MSFSWALTNSDVCMFTQHIHSMSAIEIIIMLTMTATMTTAERIKNNKFAGLTWGKLNFRISKHHAERWMDAQLGNVAHADHNNDSFCTCHNWNDCLKSTNTIIPTEHTLRAYRLYSSLRHTTWNTSTTNANGAPFITASRHDND